MRLELTGIEKRGEPNEEQVVLRANSPLTLNRFLVLATVQYSSGSVAAGGLMSYWFPAQELEVGDTVVLYTGPGEMEVRERSDGSNTYVFYWGRKTTLFGHPASTVVLLEAESWTTAESEPGLQFKSETEELWPEQ